MIQLDKKPRGNDNNMSRHKYSELSHRLRIDIQNGIYVSGQKLPSENELAKLTGYSRQTVRQAIGVLEKEGLVDRVRGSGTYVRSVKPHRKPTHNIAVVTTYISEYIFPAILQGVDQVLSQNGYTPLLNATRNRVDNERKILTELLHKPIDGLIVEGTKTALPNPNIDLYEKLNQLGIPVVFINGYYPDLKNPVYVVADDRAGGRMACELLLKKGHTKIAGIFKSDDIQGHRRYAGYAEALRSVDIAVDDDQVLWYTTENRDSLFTHILSSVLNGCSAVVCYNDEVAIDLLHNRYEFERMAASPLEIVSFDKSTFSRISGEPFLSLSNPKEKLGALAAQKIVNILNGKAEQAAVLPWGLD